MIIKNFERLARSENRRLVLKIAEAGYEAINTQQAVNKLVKYQPKKNFLSIPGKKFDLGKFKRVFLLTFGKAALDSSNALKSIMGQSIYKAVVIDVADTADKSPHYTEGSWQYFQATHPHTSEQNVAATSAAIEMLSGLTASDLVICSISGGGSAIFEMPYELKPEQTAAVFKAMTKGGANIAELNTVRKHLSLVKGGQLAKLLYPAAIINLIFSDVPGDDLSVIASGPLVKDLSSAQDAEKLIQKFKVLEETGFNQLKLVETPKDDKYFKNIENFLLVSPKIALLALKHKAEELGLQVKIFDEAFQGEAKILGPEIVAANKSVQCLIGAGESTVKIIGTGQGGRNQEMALAALETIGDSQVLGCFASDGHDNTDSAGAIIDTSTLLRSKALSLVPSAYLNNNDSFNFFKAVDDSIDTGFTGSNVADFFICLNLKSML